MLSTLVSANQLKAWCGLESELSHSAALWLLSPCYGDNYSSINMDGRETMHQVSKAYKEEWNRLMRYLLENVSEQPTQSIKLMPSVLSLFV